MIRAIATPRSLNSSKRGETGELAEHGCYHVKLTQLLHEYGLEHSACALGCLRLLANPASALKEAALQVRGRLRTGP